MSNLNDSSTSADGNASQPDTRLLYGKFHIESREFTDWEWQLLLMKLREIEAT